MSELGLVLRGSQHCERNISGCLSGSCSIFYGGHAVAYDARQVGLGPRWDIGLAARWRTAAVTADLVQTCDGAASIGR